MILHLTPNSAWWVRGAAFSVLILHIAGACVGLAAGVVAIVARKGGRLHRSAGWAFFGAMLVMAGIGGVVAAMLPQMGSVVMGFFTCYLVATGRAAVRRGQRDTRFESGAGVVAFGLATLSVLFGVQAARSASGMVDGSGPPQWYVFGVLIGLAGVGDWRLAWRGVPVGGARITRHLWRMCVALLVAEVSFFLGQQRMFPAGLRGSPLLFVPELATLAVLGWWLVRMGWRRRGRRGAVVADMAEGAVR